MTSQSRSEIINALASQITTADIGFSHVTSVMRNDEEISSDQYPALLISERPSTYPNSPTSLQFVNMELELAVLTKNEGDTPETVARNLHDNLVDALNDDVTFGGTCRYFDFIGSESPFYWRQQEIFLMYMRILVQYRRDV